MKIKIYTAPSCSGCINAKNWMNSKGLKYEEIVVGFDCTREELLALVPNARTLPQIFVNERSVGGYEDLVRELSFDMNTIEN